jgi:hypothetical protein
MPVTTLIPTELAPAVPIVKDAYDKWSGIAIQAFNAAQSLVARITPDAVPLVNFNIPFEISGAPGAYATGDAPDPFDLTKGDPGAVAAPPDLPAFPALADLLNIPIPTEHFSFTPGQYQDDMLAAVKSTIRGMMSGQFVLPEPAATALRNRAYDAANREEARATDAAYGEFAARGFDEPPGMLRERLAEVHDTARQARMGANRDVYVQDQQIAQENLRAGVAAGVQLEQVLVGLFTAQEQLQLEAAKFALDIAVRIFETRIRQLVALGELTAAQAQVYTAKVQALLGFYRAQIEKYDSDTKRIEVKKDGFVANVELFKAKAQVSQIASEADARAFTLKLERERAKVDTALKEAEQNFEQIRYVTTLAQEARKTLAEVQSQLASAAMNAVHIGASLGYSGSESVSWGTSISGSLDAETA